MADRLREIALTALGLALVMMPVALWAAWTDTVFYAVLVACAVALVLFTLLSRA